MRPASKTSSPASPPLVKERSASLKGGIYSWQPESKSEGLWHSVTVNFLPFFTVSSGTITAMLVSGFVPADGWQPRHRAHASFLLTWIFSFLATNWLKQLGGENFPRFWITFAKDVLVTAGTLAALMYIQVGPFNDCSSYTLWGRKGLALPGMPQVEAILNSRIRNVYPAIAFTSIGIQLVLIPLVVFKQSPRALRVLLQSDDRTLLWPRWLRQLLFGRVGYHENQSQELIPLTHVASPDDLVEEDIGLGQSKYSKISPLLFSRPRVNATFEAISRERVNPPSNLPNASRSHERLNTPSNFPTASRGREAFPPEALRSPKSSIDEATIEASSSRHAPQSSSRTTKKSKHSLQRTILPHSA